MTIRLPRLPALFIAVLFGLVSISNLAAQDKKADKKADRQNVQGTVQDISDQVGSEETIQRLSRHNELILNYAAEGIIGVDTKGKVTFANPAAAAKLSVEKKYLASTVEQNTIAISHLRYIPSVSGAETAVKLAATEMKTAGMLSPSTDVAGLANRAFVHLDGVSDEWLNSLQVEKVVGGQVPPGWDIRRYAQSSLSDSFCSACFIPPATR